MLKDFNTLPSNGKWFLMFLVHLDTWYQGIMSHSWIPSHKPHPQSAFSGDMNRNGLVFYLQVAPMFFQLLFVFGKRRLSQTISLALKYFCLQSFLIILLLNDVFGFTLSSHDEKWCITGSTQTGLLKLHTTLAQFWWWDWFRRGDTHCHILSYPSLAITLSVISVHCQSIRSAFAGHSQTAARQFWLLGNAATNSYYWGQASTKLSDWGNVVVLSHISEITFKRCISSHFLGDIQCGLSYL